MDKKLRKNEEIIILKIFKEEIILKNNSKSITKYHQKEFNHKLFRIKNNSTIASIKMIISDIEEISSEKIHLFFLDDNKEIISNEKGNIASIILKKINQDFFNKNKHILEELNDTENIDYIKTRLNINFYPNIFYIIIDSSNIKYFDFPNYTICIIIDFYQQNIDKIIFNLDASCSLFLLKNIINNKLKNNANIKINIKQIKLFCIDVTEIEEEKIMTNNIKNTENIVFQDWKNLNDIIEYFYHTEEKEKIGFKYYIHFLLTIVNKIQMSEKMGLNFRFNYLKEVNKISFDENAPKYCECSDGINLFIFCINEDCSLYNKYFIVNIGYGVFDILRQSKKVKCPKCNSKDYLELKNIGIINSKYYYKGILKTKNKKKSIIEGDNITLDDKLYIFKEAKINSFLSELYIEAKPHFIIEEKYTFSKRTKEDNELDDIYLNDIINKTKKINNNKNLKEFKNSNNIKIYDNESDLIDKNDIIIDGIDSDILDKANCAESVYFLYPYCYFDDNINSNCSYSDKLSSACYLF